LVRRKHARAARLVRSQKEPQGILWDMEEEEGSAEQWGIGARTQTSVFPQGATGRGAPRGVMGGG